MLFAVVVGHCGVMLFGGDCCLLYVVRCLLLCDVCCRWLLFVVCFCSLLLFLLSFSILLFDCC